MIKLFIKISIILVLTNTSLIFSYPIADIESTAFAMNFSPNKGELLFDTNTNEVTMKQSTVIETYLDDVELLNDPFIGVTVEGSGHFSGDPNLFPNITITDFTMTFKNGLETILIFEIGTHSIQFVQGNTSEAFDQPVEMSVTSSSFNQSPFHDTVSARAIWRGTVSYTKDTAGNWRVTDALALVPVDSIPEPNNHILFIICGFICFFRYTKNIKKMNKTKKFS